MTEWLWLLAAVGLIYCGINVLFRRTTCYKNRKFDSKTFREQCEQQASAVVLGSTYAKFAFGVCSEYNWSWADWTMQAKSLDVDLAILKKYCNLVKKGGYVFITLAACCMLFKGADQETFYDALGILHNPKRTLRGMIKFLFPIGYHIGLLKKFLGNDKKYNTVYDTCPGSMIEKASRSVLKGFADGWCRLFGLKDLKQGKLSHENLRMREKNRKILAQIVDTATGNGLVPIIVVPPFSKRLNDYFSKEFSEVVLDTPVKSVLKNRKALYLNYQWDVAFQEHPEYYCDGGFRLNHLGSTIFIERLAADLLQKQGLSMTNLNMGA